MGKATDFGIARLSNANQGATHITNTVCPSTDVCMFPEVVDKKAVYTDKIDCFVCSVIVLQMLARLFLKPGD